MATQVETEGRRLSRGGGMFRALSHRNYRIFWTGAFLSNVGTWMQAVAQGWLVYDLTHSAFWLGLDAFMATAPGLALTLAGGVFADLVDRRRLLIITQIGSGLTALTLAFLIATGILHDASGVWMILLLSFVTGSCMALAGPSYQAIMIDLVGREDLANAIALGAIQFQLSRVLGPMLAGFGLKAFGAAGCFLVNGLSYFAIVAALTMVHLEKATVGAHSVKDKRALWRDLIAGFSYVRRRPRVFWLLMISSMTTLFGAPYLSMMPLFAREVLHVSETGYAVMMGMSGAGALCGALMLAFLGDFKNKGWTVLFGSLAFALCLIGFSLSTQLTVSLIFVFGMGFAIVNSVAVINALLQKLVTDEMRGRVMSMFILSFIGMMPIGNLVAGSAANRFGAPHTLATGGIVIAIFILVVMISVRRLRELH